MLDELSVRIRFPKQNVWDDFSSGKRIQMTNTPVAKKGGMRAADANSRGRNSELV